MQKKCKLIENKIDDKRQRADRFHIELPSFWIEAKLDAKSMHSSTGFCLRI